MSYFSFVYLKGEEKILKKKEVFKSLKKKLKNGNDNAEYQLAIYYEYCGKKKIFKNCIR